MNRIYLTAEGQDKMFKELAELKKRRQELSYKIEAARLEGDLSENAEYHAAKELQGHVQAKIADLEDKLGRAELMDTSNIDLSKVRIGVKVRLLDIELDDEISYTIMGDEEADIDKDEIGVGSPLSLAMLGKSVGEEFELKAPRGTFRYKILDITLP